MLKVAKLVFFEASCLHSNNYDMVNYHEVMTILEG